MKNNVISQIVVAVILIGLLVVIVNPVHLWMPSMVHVVILALVVAVFGIFATFILREKSSDERENAHRMLAGRAAFLTGSVVLIMGIIVQSISETLDVWLVAALVLMIIAKISTRLYSDYSL